MTVNKMIGTAQDGLRAMSSNVAFGEKNTPIIRPMGLMAGCDCASGAGMDVVVAIEVPPPQERLLGAFVLPSTLHYARMPEKFQRLPDPYFTGSSGTASEQLLRVGMHWTMEDLLDWPSFYKLPGAHHRHACGHLRQTGRLCEMKI